RGGDVRHHVRFHVHGHCTGAHIQSALFVRMNDRPRHTENFAVYRPRDHSQQITRPFSIRGEWLRSTEDHRGDDTSADAEVWSDAAGNPEADQTATILVDHAWKRSGERAKAAAIDGACAAVGGDPRLECHARNGKDGNS